MPSQAWPAGQIVHVVRVLLLCPPDVNEPAPHTEQAPACASAYLLSAPHGLQESWPAAENVPAAQGVWRCEPSHEKPAGQPVQVVRVRWFAPPLVKEPAAHVSHSEASARLCFASCPHSEHASAPPGAKYPAPQRVCSELPLHENPGGHAAHAVRVADEAPPLVNEPAAHVEHCPAPDTLYLLSEPQAGHESEPIGA